MNHQNSRSSMITLSTKNYFSKYFDIIYIINLDKNTTKKLKCIYQLEKYNITNYKFIKAVDTVTTNKYLKYYETVTRTMSPDFIKYNFTKGALGCALSHYECLYDAIQNNYQKILILEDDFIFIDSFDLELQHLFECIDDAWDFLYLGKKQGEYLKDCDIIKKIHTNANYFQITPINDYIYRPSYATWATHALLIKQSLFKEIMKLIEAIDAPIDILIMKLYDQYSFYVCKKDLIISYEDSSDIRHDNKIIDTHLWGWNHSIYQQTKLTSLSIQNIIIYGLKKTHHTHFYIHKMYYDFIQYYYPNCNVYWFNDDETIDETILTDCLIFSAPCHEKYMNLPIRENIYYIFHLDIFDNVGYKNIEEFLKDSKYRPIIQSKKYLILICREEITELKYFDQSIQNHMICLPWFSNNFYDNIIHIKKNLSAIYKKNNKKKYFCYFGSVWSLNIDLITQLINYCIEHRIYLLIKGRVFDLSDRQKKQVQDSTSEYYTFVPFNYRNNGVTNDNDFTYLDSRYGIKALLPLQGSNHNTNYISNRLFECICHGYLAFTNNEISSRYFKSSIHHEKLEELMNTYVDILKNENIWKKKMEAQIDELLSKFYGYHPIQRLFHCMNELSVHHTQTKILLNQNKNTPYKYNLYITSNKFYQNKYYKPVHTNEELRNVFIQSDHYILYDNDAFDPYLIEQMIQYVPYMISIDVHHRCKNKYLELCKKYNKTLNIKEPLKIICLLSGQRTGSTLIIDYIQKTSSSILALSEIFYYYNNEFTYLNSYDVTNPCGVLFGKTIEPIQNGDIKTYFKQYEDILFLENKKMLIFKLTIDFNQELTNFMYLDEIIEFICHYPTIFLERNEMDSYISKKCADQYGYSHTIYSNLDNIKFDLKEMYDFIQNNHQFKNTYLPKFKKVTYIDYEMFKPTDHKGNIDKINNLLHSIDHSITPDLTYREYFNTKGCFNTKQNPFDTDELLKLEHWN